MMIRKILLLGAVFIPLLSICQKKSNVHFSIDSTVNKINMLCIGKVKSFTKEKILKGKKIKEKWEYFNSKKLSFIFIEYKIDSTTYSEKYYLKDDGLIYAYEKELYSYPSFGLNEYSIWAGDFYFIKRELIYHETLGHGKSESEEDDWHPEKEIPLRLKKRKAELVLLK